ncbi:MAG: TolC family protein [Isosphaeraceae bacterium]
MYPARRNRVGRIAALLLIGLAARSAWAQGPTINPSASELPGGGGSLLGQPPGGGASSTIGQEPDAAPLSGRVGPGVPRAPQSITSPGGRTAGPAPSIGAPAEMSLNNPPMYGALSVPDGSADEGPPNGLTLDQAIDLLVHQNLGLRSRFLEIPQARADVLTASLRANPVFYADTQLVPYGTYSRSRPGGPTQYDVNISLPLDVTGKRRARTDVAERALQALEAQYQDAVRLFIDNLYVSFVDVLSARQTVWFAKASVEGMNKVYRITRELKEVGGVRTQADVNRVGTLLGAAELGLADAEEAQRKANRNLAALLNLPPQGSDSLEVRGTLLDLAPTPPPVADLQQLALKHRPDLIAFRLGMLRAEADVRLARANRLQDLYLLYQPYTYQNNAPFGVQSTTSWAVGLTVPLPVFNRNQGNIQRAEINVSQTQLEMSALERQILTDVESAAAEYTLTRKAVERLEKEILPAARQVRDDTYRLFLSGEVEVILYLNAQRDYNEAVRQYRDTLARHRRGMLGLNTSVGLRLLP